MRPGRFLTLVAILGVAAGMTTGGSAKKEAALSPAAEAKAPTPVDGGKIPLTTASAGAKAEFLQGRHPYEKSLDTASVPHLQKAISLHPNLAWADVALGN